MRYRPFLLPIGLHQENGLDQPMKDHAITERGRELAVFAVTFRTDTSVNTQTQNEDTTEFEPKSSQAGSEKQSTSIAENSRNGGTISSTSLHSGKPVNRKRKTDIPIDMAIKELKAISKENKEQVEDEFDLFCKSLAIQLKKMP
ncbi:hypothetical protein EVAR_12178_1 [Eumeta japonica]|uniref:Uncharacterized protein n=1 Tax=Eumeta variegata TaxID=151549 RepID=A0A4C1UHB2_EUMVA|nr:hypothetical protein EVAR_12178_1 [Eumeta japonica]